MYSFLEKRLGRRAAIAIQTLWYLMLMLVTAYYSVLDQAPFRYAEL
ncbi:MAG TPA: hypothetical protein VEB64_17880 [Azospirillaceae bacterium]|nr:hypothetical protein [Azospirillaceae bacterium]